MIYFEKLKFLFRPKKPVKIFFNFHCSNNDFTVLSQKQCSQRPTLRNQSDDNHRVRRFCHVNKRACFDAATQPNAYVRGGPSTRWHCNSAVSQERLSEGRGRIRALQSDAHF